MDRATAIQDWLFETIANHFAAALETATGERPATQWERVPASLSEPADSGKQGLQWRQSFESPPGAICITAAGQRESDGDAARSAYLELVAKP